MLSHSISKTITKIKKIKRLGLTERRCKIPSALALGKKNWVWAWQGWVHLVAQNDLFYIHEYEELQTLKQLLWVVKVALPIVFFQLSNARAFFSKATCRFREQWLAMLLHSSKIGFLLHPDICKESTKFHFQVKTNSWKHRRQSQLKINIEQGLLTRPCKGLLSLAYSQNLKCYYSPFYEWSLMRSK